MKIGSIVVLKKSVPEHLRRLGELLGSKIPEINTEYVVSDMRKDDYGDWCIAIDEITPIFVPFTGEYIYWLRRHFKEVQPPMDLTELIEESQTTHQLI